MNRKVYRDENPKLFRSNLVANAVCLPMVAGASALLLADAAKEFGLLH